jgi:hypothetical protein
MFSWRCKVVRRSLRTARSFGLVDADMVKSCRSPSCIGVELVDGGGETGSLDTRSDYSLISLVSEGIMRRAGRRITPISIFSEEHVTIWISM